MRQIRAALCAMAVVLLCSGTAWGAEDILGESPGAMSPNMTRRSLGARLEETALGDYVADALRLGSGADLAIECGGHLVRSLPGGTLTEAEVRGVFAQDLEVIVAELTAEQLFRTLEYAVGPLRLDEAEGLDRDSAADCFPQISGFSFEFDVSQLPGRRVRRVVLADGQELDPEDQGIWTVAMPEDMADGSLGFPLAEEAICRRVGRQWELLADHVRGQGSVVIPRTGRIVMVGSAEDTLYEMLGLRELLPYILVVVLLFRFLMGRRKKQNTGA